MGELHDAVSALVEAFSHGISIIGTQRGQRRKQKLAIDSTTKSAEENLNRSFRRNKTEVENAYGKDLARFGPGFAAGDGTFYVSFNVFISLDLGISSGSFQT
jgi:hypothetical protein